MPFAIDAPEFQHIQIKKLHPKFGGEVSGVDFSKEISDEVFGEILRAMDKARFHVYGVCVYRNTGLDDRRHVQFSRRFGELDDIRPYLTKGRKMRYDYLELFDAGNVDENGNLLTPGHPRSQYNKGNSLFHVDSSFNPRRASYSLLRGAKLPPPETGGNTDFADTRTAYDDLPITMKEKLIKEDYTVAHSIHHSRKLAAPEFFADLDPTTIKMYAHRLLQLHEPSSRMNLYIAAHAHHVEGIPKAESDTLVKELLDHCTQEKYTFSVKWENEGDMIIWDNTCCMHRSGKFEGGYVRDMRRTTVHDGSSTAWGVNRVGEGKAGFLVNNMGMQPERESLVVKDGVVV